jgi:hypothetical protein
VFLPSGTGRGRRRVDFVVVTIIVAGHGSRAACTVFSLSEAGIVGPNPTQGMDV